MLKIKLSRQGKKGYPVYRLIITEAARDPYGDHLEILGAYNPHTKVLEAKAERIKYWLSQGAQMTPTINNLLIAQKVIEGKKVAVSKLTKKTRAAAAKQVADAQAAETKAKTDAETEAAKPATVASEEITAEPETKE